MRGHSPPKTGVNALIVMRGHSPPKTGVNALIAHSVTSITSALAPACDKRGKWKAQRAF